MRLIQIVGESGSWGHMGGVGMGVGGGLLLVLPFLSIGWIVWFSARNWTAEPATRRSPVDVLDERYASGEIDRDEYLQRRADFER